MQKLNSKSMEEWGNASAFFNGTQVEIKLHVAPNEKNIHLDVSKYLVGDVISANPESQCGPNDDRTATTDGAIGRIMPEGCTGWLIPNGNFLTAGHCCSNAAGIDILEFYVPASNADGTTNAANPVNQYPVNDATINFQDAGIGDDWCVFSVGTNSTTGKTPVEQNGIIGSLDYSFYRTTLDNTSATTRITGYGVDFVPAGSTGGYNAQNQTEQTHTGPFVAEVVSTATNVSLRYTVDTEGGNSGSPIIMDGTKNTLGIHTNAGCNTSVTPGYNQGTGFEADDTETGIVNSTASNNKYVDENHPSPATPSGTVFRPYKTVNAGITSAATNDILNIAEGSYTETVVITKQMVLKAPVGLVIIGPDAPLSPKPLADNTPTFAKNIQHTDDVNIVVLPNPVYDVCNIDLSIPTTSNLLVQLSNSLGQVEQVLAQVNHVKQGVLSIKVDMTELKAGMYFLNVKMNDQTFTKKIIKM
jgi:V8-like Glu-specific endopeptidase